MMNLKYKTWWTQIWRFFLVMEIESGDESFKINLKLFSSHYIVRPPLSPHWFQSPGSNSWNGLSSVLRIDFSIIYYLYWKHNTSFNSLIHYYLLIKNKNTLISLICLKLIKFD